MWDGICSSQWFRYTPIVRLRLLILPISSPTAICADSIFQILFLNKEDLFRVRVPMAHIKNTFPDYEGAPGDVDAGKEYFLKRFLRLAAKGARARPTTAQNNAPKGKTGFTGTLHGDRGVRRGGGGGAERTTADARVTKEHGVRANVGRSVYHHFTNATDTTMLRVVMSAVVEWAIYLFLRLSRFDGISFFWRVVSSFGTILRARTSYKWSLMLREFCIRVQQAHSSWCVIVHHPLSPCLYSLL